MDVIGQNVVKTSERFGGAVEGTCFTSVYCKEGCSGGTRIEEGIGKNLMRSGYV